MTSGAASSSASCAHPTRHDGVCTACGDCEHDVILNGACLACGRTDLDGRARSPRQDLLPPASLVRSKK